jgi:hypothetical protein
MVSVKSTGRVENNMKLSAPKNAAFILPIIAKIIFYQSYEKIDN